MPYGIVRIVPAWLDAGILPRIRPRSTWETTLPGRPAAFPCRNAIGAQIQRPAPFRWASISRSKRCSLFPYQMTGTVHSPFALLASTIATMARRIGSGSVGQALTTAASPSKLGPKAPSRTPRRSAMKSEVIATSLVAESRERTFNP